MLKAESFLSLLRFVPSAAHPWIGYLLSDQQACLLQSEIGHPLSSLPTGAVLRHTMKEAGLGLVVQLVSACLTTIKAWIWISSTPIKRWAQWHVSVTPSLTEMAHYKFRKGLGLNNPRA